MTVFTNVEPHGGLLRKAVHLWYVTNVGSRHKRLPFLLDGFGASTTPKIVDFMVSEGTIMLWFKVSVWLKIILFSKAINGSKKEHHAFPTIPSAPTWLTDQAHTRYFRIISLNSHKQIYYSYHQKDIKALRGQTFGKYVLWAWNIIVNLEYGFINRSMPLLHFMIWEIITIINKKWSF